MIFFIVFVSISLFEWTYFFYLVQWGLFQEYLSAVIVYKNGDPAAVAIEYSKSSVTEIRAGKYRSNLLPPYLKPTGQ